MAEQIIIKRCTKCKETKPLSKFSKRSNRPCGYQSECKSCRLEYQRKYRQTERGKAIHKAGNQRYNRSEKGKFTLNRYYTRYPEKKKAKDAVGKAIKSGKLLEPTSLQCSCGKQAAQYHHHKGYAPEHRLDVIPLCIKCHSNTRS